jgi:glycosyltransferase involved in cell wall biosynthesis
MHACFSNWFYDIFNVAFDYMPEKHQNKALCVLNFSGRFGGAEKRYATLFNHLMVQGADYYLIMNTRLYRLLVNSFLLRASERIILFNDGGDGIPRAHVNSRKQAQEVSRKSTARLFLGRWKYFLRTMLLWLRFSLFFIRQIQKKQIKTIYGVWQGGIWTWMWCRLLKVKLIFSVNSSGMLNMETNVTKFFDSQYWVLQHADVADFLSPSLKENYTREMGGKIGGHCVVTPNSFIDYTHYYAVFPKKPWVVFLGRLEPIKNPMIFLEAVRIIQQTMPAVEITYFVMGTGNMLNSMQRFVSRNQLRNVRFTGLHSKPWQILRESSVFVSLQRDENYPSQSLIEAMACENGIVVTDVGDTRMLVTESEGLFTNAEPMDVADNIIKLLINPDLREKTGEKAREKVIHYHTIDRFARWFDDMMND